MDKIKKALNRLSLEEKQKIKEILLQIDKGSFQNLDTKKLKGKDNIFRIRKGNIRIIFCKRNNSIKILTIERRGSKTHKKR
ncbi:type II toxin-antitoxin system RelE/ParE family toxin [Patescibacteria group bacterium]|nr:type II toxin-antitoxin system RelE/ParE family toxin [Patescibacteria group bacterium]MBU1563797.1 type II toxin-antitoxin system RelE/ParE family toxin [Patescibacteria group bacterium]